MSLSRAEPAVIGIELLQDVFNRAVNQGSIQSGQNDAGNSPGQFFLGPRRDSVGLFFQFLGLLAINLVRAPENRLEARNGFVVDFLVVRRPVSPAENRLTFR